MDERYARGYRSLYERHWWWRAREELVLETLRRLRPERGWSRILDVGCGDGLFFGSLEPFGPVEGVEMDPSGLRSEGPPDPRIHLRPFDRSFQPGRTYGLILMLDVLEHFEDPLEALCMAAALLEPGGSLLLTVPAFLALWTSHDELNRHRTRYTRGRVTALARQAGMRVESASYFFRWTVPFKLGAHFAEKLFPARPSPPRIPPDWLNAALFRLSTAEQRLLGRFPVPFGSSLIAVASKAV